MDSELPVEMYFFPFVGGGHQIPMIDTARVFSAHGAKSTILSTTLSNALRFRNCIHRDQTLHRLITIHVLDLPNDAAKSTTSMSAAPFTDTSAFQQPLKHFLSQHPPDCVVIDIFHRWASEVIDSLGIPRIVFNGNGFFSRCVRQNVGRFGPHEKVGSDSDPFVVPGLPDRVELTMSQLPIFARKKSGGADKIGQLEDKSFGIVVNSFYELESKYVDYFKNDLKKKAWGIGPVSLCNGDEADKSERGQAASVDEEKLKWCLNWLESKEPNSVVYISFGSLVRLSYKQLIEIGHGLENSTVCFVWVIGKVFVSENESYEDEENWLVGFEKRMREIGRGVVLRGWAPQILMLEHKSVGGFVSHCGWNSTLESVCAGVPMVTWPLSAEQFSNEKLITDLLGIGVQVGSREWASWNMERKEVIGREKVEAAVRRVVGGGDEAVEMRKRASDLLEKAKRAVEEGGSSYEEVDALISELKSLKQN
ncbi:abscisate beta-glucosyltransferase-like [Argentina anserina]|uniref:abscisate beta-glucosyltransferase-like n=1 Tax=Argentina anserina TaxID=57926 RepID=UPI0021766127|nr:abscisate beta-glucosyltransferase-like [Potentilla anserina]